MNDRDSSNGNCGTGGGTAPYLRVSTDHQTTENQRPDIDRYLSGYNLAPYAWYVDDATSGKWVPFSERPEGRRLLADARAGHVALVLVWRLDRLGRNAYEILGAVRQLEEAGARLVSLKEQFDTRTAAGRLMLGVLASIAEFEWESMQERSEADLARRLASGAWMGGPVPYGLRMDGAKHEAKLVPDETPLGIAEYPQLTAAGVVRLIYQLTVDEHLSGGDIADRLNQMDVPTAFRRRGLTRYRRGGRDVPALHIWRADTVIALLNNPVYKGIYTFGRRARHTSEREIVTFPVPALVSVETWEAARVVLERNQFWNVRNAKREYLLRGLLVCGLCGYHYTGSGGWYHCLARRRAARLWGRELAASRRCADSLPLRAAKIEAEVWGQIERCARHPDEALAELAVRLHGTADATSGIRAELAEQQQQQEALQQERDALHTYYLKGRMSERDLDRQKDRIAGEERHLSAEVARLTDRLSQAEAVAARLAAAAALLEDIRGTLDGPEPLTPARKRAIVEQLVDEMKVQIGTNPATGKRRAVVHVTYCFDLPADPPVGADADAAGHITCTTDPAYTMVCKLPRQLIEK